MRNAGKWLKMASAKGNSGAHEYQRYRSRNGNRQMAWINLDSGRRNEIPIRCWWKRKLGQIERYRQRKKAKTHKNKSFNSLAKLEESEEMKIHAVADCAEGYVITAISLPATSLGEYRGRRLVKPSAAIFVLIDLSLIKYNVYDETRIFLYCWE